MEQNKQIRAPIQNVNLYEPLESGEIDSMEENMLTTYNRYSNSVLGLHLTDDNNIVVCFFRGNNPPIPMHLEVAKCLLQKFPEMQLTHNILDPRLESLEGSCRCTIRGINPLQEKLIPSSRNELIARIARLEKL